MGINPASLGYVYPQQQQTNGTSRVTTGAKAGLFGFGAAGAATYFGDFKGLTPVDANGMLFEEGLHVLEDKSLIKKGLDTASFNAQKDFLKSKGIFINSAEELTALKKYAQTGEIADSFKNILPKGSYNDVRSEIMQIMNYGTADEQVTKINQILKRNNLSEVGSIEEARKIIKSVKTQKNAISPISISQKDIAKQIETSTAFGKVAAAKAARTTSLEGASAYLSGLNKTKAYYESLPETKEAIIKFLKDGGSKSTDEQLAKAAENLITNRTKIMNNINSKITAQQNVVTNLQTPLKAKFATFFDKARGTLKEGAPSELVKYFKNFKLHKALKYGAIGAVICLAGGLLFGGKD